MPEQLTCSIDADDARLAFGGDWRLPKVGLLDRLTASAVADLERASPRRVRLELGLIEGLDTAGGWLIVRTAEHLRERRLEVELAGARPEHTALLDRLSEARCSPAAQEQVDPPLVRLVLRLGRTTIGVVKELGQMLTFAGGATVALGRQLLDPRRVRGNAVVHHLEQAGVNAIPIVALMSFLIGVVLAYQGADQLRQFGAEIFTVNLLALAVLRELGVLLTAIMVAGRSGSAFTAQIGSMQVNEELDAMEVIGLDRFDVLVTPRIVALAIALPLLTFIASIMALVGGGLVVVLVLDIPTIVFLRQLREAVSLDIFIAGMIKAPVFAILIATVGCYMGLKVKGSAESVGRLTTQSVVVGIFLVIVVNAAFSVLFATFGI